VIADLQSRFLNEKCHAISTLPLLLSRFIIKTDTYDTDTLLKIIKEHFTLEDNNIIDELELKKKLQQKKTRWNTKKKKNEGNY